MVKQTVYGDSSRQAILRVVDRLANGVKVTLGSMGRNFVVDNTFGSPTITKDSVTIARDIDIKDALEHMGAPMVNDPFDMTGLLRPPAAPTPTRELLFEFRIHHGTVACELRCHSEWEVEARFVGSDGHVGLHQRFATRALAVEWAEEEQRAMERME